MFFVVFGLKPFVDLKSKFALVSIDSHNVWKSGFPSKNIQYPYLKKNNFVMTKL